MDIHQSPNYAKFMNSIGWIVEKDQNTNIFVRKIGPTSVVKIQRSFISDSKSLETILKKYRPLLIKFEPLVNSNFNANTFNLIKDNWPLIPTKTIVLDLDSLSLETLPKDTRYEIRKAISNNLVVQQSTDITSFYSLLQETMKIGGWSVPIKKEVVNLYKSFHPNNSALLFVYKATVPIAGCLLIWEGDTAHYMYAALTKSGRELGAAYFLLWDVINFLQKKKIKYLDLEGIYDDRYPNQTKRWQGFTKFKMCWNGKVIEYPGSWTRYANPLLSLMFKLP